MGPWPAVARKRLNIRPWAHGISSLFSEGERGRAPCRRPTAPYPMSSKYPAFYSVFLLFPFCPIFWSMWLKMGKHGVLYFYCFFPFPRFFSRLSSRRLVCPGSKPASKQARKGASEQASKQASQQASERASERASKQGSQRANQASKQASKQARARFLDLWVCLKTDVPGYAWILESILI